MNDILCLVTKNLTQAVWQCWGGGRNQVVYTYQNTNSKNFYSKRKEGGQEGRKGGEGERKAQERLPPKFFLTQVLNQQSVIKLNSPS